MSVPVLRRALPGLIAVFSLLPAGAGAATLAERLASLATHAGEVLPYEEQRSSTLLDRNVTYRGRLAWDPATGQLTKWVDAPRKARLTLTPTTLEAQTGSGRARRLPLEQRPELAGLFNGLRALLGGDAQALENSFKADYLEGDGGAWVLHLVPRDEGLAARLSLLEIRGEGDRVRSIDTVLADGERQHMRILPAETGDAASGAADAEPDAG